MNRRGYGIYINTIFQGPVLTVIEANGDDANDSDAPCVFSTEREEQLEIVDGMIIRHQQFINGERDFENAVAFLEEYVVAVDVLPDGTIIDEDGNELA